MRRHARPEGAVNDIHLPTPRAVPEVAAVPAVDDARLRGVRGGRVVRGLVEDRETLPRRLGDASSVVSASRGEVHVPAAPRGRNVRHRIVQVADLYLALEVRPAEVDARPVLARA